MRGNRNRGGDTRGRGPPEDGAEAEAERRRPTEEMRIGREGRAAGGLKEGWGGGLLAATVG